MTHSPLVDEYAEKIRPLLPLAQRAYGAKTQRTPAHEASREYTRLIQEFHEQGGSLIALSRECGVAYSGMRRRLATANAPVTKQPPRRRFSEEEITESVARVASAKSMGSEQYHAQLWSEYKSGVSLNAIAKSLGIHNASPLYYGVQRHAMRLENVTVL
jgi:transposase-like protein